MFDFFNNINPVAFNIPIGEGFPVFWYAIIIVAGIFLGGLWAAKEVELIPMWYSDQAVTDNTISESTIDIPRA